MMIRFLLYLMSLAVVTGALPARALASDATGDTQKHFAPMEDWELPSFVASPSAGTNSAPAPSHQAKQTFVAAALPKLASAGQSTVLASAAKHVLSSSSKTSGLAHDSKSAVTQSSKSSVGHAIVQAMASTAHAAQHEAEEVAEDGLRLARLTAYWASEGDYYTERHLSSTGVRLHSGLCAVDPSIIPYGSVVVIPGVGQFLAADTGSAVVSREAAREAGRTRAERGALVIDLYFDCRSEGEAFAAQRPKFVPISWWTPSSTTHAAQTARSVFAEEDWNKIYSKQL